MTKIEVNVGRFLRWPSIENSYREKFIQKAVEEFPELASCEYEVTEKLHGTNVQFYFEPGKEMRVASRNRYLEPGSKFYDIWNILPEYQQMWDAIQRYANLGGSVRMFGELYGQGVQKGVDYKPGKKIAFFGVMENNQLLSTAYLRLAALMGGYEDLLVPRVCLVKGLGAALAVDTNFPTMINPIEGNICEGVVIQPYSKVYRLSNGSTFLLKKKNEAFKERQKARKPPAPVDSEVLRLRILFMEYITVNRLESIFSKEGPIQEPSQIGAYIRYMIQDALADFLKGHEIAWDAMDKKQRGQVTKAGAAVAEMLRKYL